MGCLSGRGGWGGGELIESNVSKLGNRSSNEGSLAGCSGLNGGRGDGCLDEGAPPDGANESPKPDGEDGENDAPHGEGEVALCGEVMDPEAAFAPFGFHLAETFDLLDAAVLVGSIKSEKPSNGTFAV